MHLTPKEYAVLAELAKHPGRVLTHEHLLRTVWGPAQERQTEYLRVAIRSLRQKLEANPGIPRPSSTSRRSVIVWSDEPAAAEARIAARTAVRRGAAGGGETAVQ